MNEEWKKKNLWFFSEQPLDLGSYRTIGRFSRFIRSIVPEGEKEEQNAGENRAKFTAIFGKLTSNL